MMDLKKLIATNIKRARKRAGLSQGRLSELCGWGGGHSRVSGYESGTSEPSANDVERMAKAVGISPLWFFQDHAKKAASATAVPIISISDLERHALDRAAPVGHISIDSDYLDLNRGFAIKITDSDMQPEFMPGAHVVVKLCSEPTKGAFVVAEVSGKMVFKKLVEDAGKRYLISLNTYPAIEVTHSTIIIGVAVAQVKKYL